VGLGRLSSSSSASDRSQQQQRPPSVDPGIDGNVDKSIDCEAVPGNALVQLDANHQFNGVTRALPHPPLGRTGVNMESSAHRVAGVGPFQRTSPRVLATPGR
jgi:hypothetical protein